MSEECEAYQDRTGATTMTMTGMLMFGGIGPPVGAQPARRSTASCKSSPSSDVLLMCVVTDLAMVADAATTPS